LIKSNHNQITGLIISAGKSSRMGEFKPLMKYSGKTFLHQIILKLDAVCNNIIIVTGFKSGELQSETVNVLMKQGENSLIHKIRFVENDEYEKGMFTSLKKGLKEMINSDLSGWAIYHFVDQPGLAADFYTGFTEQIDYIHNWIQPSFKKSNGHPILLREDLIDIILNCDDNSNLRELSGNPIVRKKFWECGYKNILQDIDTPQDYISNMKP
jgi:molybdenum cofactor cytidylyltransferase